MYVYDFEHFIWSLYFAYVFQGISYMVGDDGQCQKSSLEKKMSEYCVPGL